MGELKQIQDTQDVMNVNHNYYYQKDGIEQPMFWCKAISTNQLHHKTPLKCNVFEFIFKHSVWISQHSLHKKIKFRPEKQTVCSFVSS